MTRLRRAESTRLLVLSDVVLSPREEFARITNPCRFLWQPNDLVSCRQAVHGKLRTRWWTNIRSLPDSSALLRLLLHRDHSILRMWQTERRNRVCASQAADKSRIKDAVFVATRDAHGQPRQNLIIRANHHSFRLILETKTVQLERLEPNQ